MSIPTTFTNANCQTQIPGELNGGGMLQFCRTFKAGMPAADVCEINTQEDYDEYQLGCVNGRHGTFIDNNNNTVKLEFTQDYIPVLDAAIEFPIVDSFGKCCVSSLHGTYVNPLDGSVTTPDTTNDPATEFPTGDTAGIDGEVAEVTLPVSDSFASNDIYIPVINGSELQDLNAEDNDTESDDIDSDQSSEKSSAGVMTKTRPATLL
ncbi:hypothetical protein LPJ53_005530, partial [Coemansia erecta]